MCNGSVADKGKPNIVDRSGRHQLPIGIESFEDVLEEFTYVDKSLAVKELVDRRGVTLYCRPRRFGKSTFLRMLQCFFEAPRNAGQPTRKPLFDGLAISQDDRRYMDECSAHPVIYLNLSGCGAATYEQTLAKIASVVAAEFARHRYLYDPTWMFPIEQERFQRLTGGTASEAELMGSLTWLATLLRNHHGSQVVVLIDEYDTPVNDAHLNGFRRRVLDFYRSWLSNALKGTVDLYCAVLTGVLRVSQESIFSELNNVRFDTTLDDGRAEAIGFTAMEAAALAAYVGRSDRIAEMAEWYDGYRFGKADICNPWSVLNYLQTGEAQPYWTNTSSNGIVSDLVRRAGEEQTAELAELAGGGVVTKPLDLDTVFDDLGNNPEAVWAQLYQTGYVTTSDTRMPNDDQMPRELRIPNLEVGRLYGKELLARATRLAACARDVALAQADRKVYGHGLVGTGLVRWGVAFCGKRVAVVCDTAKLD